jgi:broad specificity phosphatase PhoE
VTSRVHLVRHAKAKNRAAWTEPDDLRPLTKRGRREAAGLAEQLGADPPTRLVSSPFLRCVQTFEPLALRLDLPIETSELLAEGSDGGAALDLMISLERAEPVACCTHGDVLYEVMGVVAAGGVHIDGPLDVPVASTWILEIEDDRVVGATFVEQPPR